MTPSAGAGEGNGSRQPRHRYLAHFRVRFHELDPLGHVNNAAYINFLEQAAIDHAAAAGYDLERLRRVGGLFIARRHEIDFLRPVLAGQWLQVVTRPAALRGARALRQYEVRRFDLSPDANGAPFDRLVSPEPLATPRDQLVVRALTEWALVDIATGRPRRIPEDLAQAFVYPVTEPGSSPPGSPPGHDKALRYGIRVVAAASRREALTPDPLPPVPRLGEGRSSRLRSPNDSTGVCMRKERRQLVPSGFAGGEDRRPYAISSSGRVRSHSSSLLLRR